MTNAQLAIALVFNFSFYAILLLQMNKRVDDTNLRINDIREDIKNLREDMNRNLQEIKEEIKELRKVSK